MSKLTASTNFYCLRGYFCEFVIFTLSETEVVDRITAILNKDMKKCIVILLQFQNLSRPEMITVGLTLRLPGSDLNFVGLF